ncbi:MAG: methyltransferase domain-containing protein [Clostridia bacterium]|nr:methyltransferase domain-containing protein [Clostridia bacterium]
MSKLHAIEKTVSMLRCPKCGGSFELTGGSLICTNGHCFDCNKRGFVNLVPSQRPTRYNFELFEARRRILEGGFYDRLIEAINGLLKQTDTIVDAGCGDGYFTSKVYPCEHKIGIDLSKEAIAIAAKGCKDTAWLVADLANLPLKEGCADVILNILSPAHYESFSRILKPEGRLIKVIPNESYLQEIRAAFNKSDYSNAEVWELFCKRNKNVSRKQIAYEVAVNEEQLKDFLTMTPMTFSIDTGRIKNVRLEKIAIALEILSGEPF